MAQIESISIARLGIALSPAILILAVLYRWSLPIQEPIVALARMFLQLSLLGYALMFVFQKGDATIVLLVCTIMIVAAGWIAARTLPQRDWPSIGRATVAIAVGGGITLTLVTQCVLQIQPWYAPRYLVPLAGMIFSNAMNAVSLAAERVWAERENGKLPEEARRIALKAALIPVNNGLLAVGLVSIPGMMTGQVLLGADPFQAARYQMMVMCMVFSSAGLAAIVFLAREK